MNSAIHKYVCKAEDLGKFLDAELTREFQSAFYDFDENGIGHPKPDSWRMFYQGMNPIKFFSRYGIDFNHPTVGVAVALDLIKIESNSVSNDTHYTFNEIGCLSPLELDRLILHRNFRVNLDIPADEVVDVVFNNQKVEKKKPIETHYQGVKLSSTVLEFISTIFENGFNHDTYVPFTNGQDILTEVALIPNNHPDFPPIVSRGYYDRKWHEYLNTLKQYGIDNISSFALVDTENGKNHTGEFLIKAMKKIEGKFRYIVFGMRYDGTFIGEDGIPSIKTYETDGIQILFLHDGDFCNDENIRNVNDIWTPNEGDVQMPISTTSSNVSVFRQMIPDEELKDVINYSQFKNRLAGMELYLKYLDKDIWMKEVQCSECFIQSTFAIQKLFNQFSENQEYVSKITQIYDLFGQFDSCTEKLVSLNGIVEEKRKLLSKLVNQYNDISANNRKLGQKIELGTKIKSLKLELTKNITVQISEISNRKNSIQKKITDIVQEINSLIGKGELSDEFKSEFLNELNRKLDAQISILEERANHIQSLLETKQEYVREDTLVEPISRSDETILEQVVDTEQFDIDATKLNDLARDTELWRGYMFNLGYELNQLNKMKVACEDATIGVRRLVYNFKQKIEETRKKVWTDQNIMKDDIDLKSLDVSSILDIIHLYDWYARNPDNLTYREAGFDSLTKFEVMKRRYHEISLGLRKYEYSVMLNRKKLNLQMILQTSLDNDADDGHLKYNDKYGKDLSDESPELWKISDVNKNQFNRVYAFIHADKELMKKRSQQFVGSTNVNFNRVHDMAIKLLIDSGLIEKEDDLENISLKPIKDKQDADVLTELESICKLRNTSLDLVDKMNHNKEIMLPIFDIISSCNEQINKLTMENSKISHLYCKLKNNKQKKELLKQKLVNESKIVDLNSTITAKREQHRFELSSLDMMREDVDRAQRTYDNKVIEFKQTIGLNQDTIDNLVIGIYNKYQDEILKTEEN